MISPEILRRYPLFAGLKHDHLVAVADAAEEIQVEAGHYFFREDDQLDTIYVNVRGAVAVVIELPDPAAAESVAGQLTGSIPTKDAVVSTVGPGEAFGWSSLVPPHVSTATTKALTDCTVIAIDCTGFRKTFETDCEFGWLMTQKAAQILRQRLKDLRLESLAFLVS